MQRILTELGLPLSIKVDNGRPFGDPKRDGLPILAMWLIGLGINVIRNRHRTPQDNAKVERCQGTLGKWTEYKKTNTTEELKQVLTREADFYNYTFRDRRRNNTTRLERHPCLNHSGRHFKSGQFNEARVVAFVSKGEWIRSVSSVGQVYITGQKFSVGIQYSQRQVRVRLDPEQKVWVVSDDDGAEISLSPPEMWTKWIKRIQCLT
jgi:hypothetical protein